MINQETKLKLQAYLDNELSGADLREIAAVLERDPEARALYAELEGTRSLLEAGELELKVPESREFYWSKIQREIQRESREATARPSRFFLAGYPRWFRILAPTGGAALVLTAALSVVRLTTGPSALSYVHELETPLEDTSVISFHSQSAGMTVVWVQGQEN
jgi:negative regulator of sigma E activity